MLCDDVKLQKCIHLAFRGHDPRDQLLGRLASYLCSSSTPALGTRSSSARSAAAVIQGLPSDPAQLRSLLTGTNVFRLYPATGGDATIQLVADALLQQAKQATTTGILTVELSPPVGYIDHVHPLRPDQRSCTQWVKFAECKFGRACVFNHPELTNSVPRYVTCGSSSSSIDRSSQGIAGPAKTQPARANTPCGSSSSQVHLSNKPSSAGYSSATTGHVQHTATASSRTAEAALLFKDPPSPPAAVAMPASAHLDALIASLGTSSAKPPAVVQSGAAASIDGSSGNPISPATAAAPPAAATAAVCPMFLMRGVCLSGSKCRYSHSVRGSQAATPELSRSATPDPVGTLSAADAASTANAANAADAFNAANAEPSLTTAAVTADVAPATNTDASTSVRASQQQLADTHSQPFTWQQAEFHPREQPKQLIEQKQHLQASHTPQQPSDTFTWQQQKHQQNKQQQLAAHQHKKKDGNDANKYKFQAAPYPMTGQTSEGLPQRLGAPNCSFYMHTGACKFKQQCVYHHPDYPAHPINFVKNGFSAAKWSQKKAVPYSRIVMHLSRIWDYDSCPEAQLKTWMARYLISVANPDCRMWDKTAAQPIVADDICSAKSDKEFAGTSLGRYSCELSRAGEFFRLMSSDKPEDEAATTPMCDDQDPPERGKLRLLFSRDPYFQVEAGQNRSQFFVKLNIAKIIETLNW